MPRSINYPYISYTLSESIQQVVSAKVEDETLAELRNPTMQ